jgi:hypothetical protein
LYIKNVIQKKVLDVRKFGERATFE